MIQLTRGLAHLGLGIVLLLTANCASAAKPCPTCQGPDRYVRIALVPSTGHTDAHFEHPLVLSREHWRMILKSLRLKSRPASLLPLQAGDGTLAVPFTDEEIEYLSEQLQRAFAACGSEEWVLFGFNEPRTADVRSLTGGVWFAEGGSLHLALTQYRFAVTLPTVQSLLWDHPLRASGDDSYEFVPGAEHVVSSPPPQLRGTVQGHPTHVAIDYHAMLSAKPASEEAMGSSQRSAPSPLHIEERLQTLERLKERNLITEEEYKSKRREILNSL